jgi:hypothetical protein
MRAALIAAIVILAAGTALAQDPEPTTADAPDAPDAPDATDAPDAPDAPDATMEAPLILKIQSAARMGQKEGVLVAVRAQNGGGKDLLLLLSEAHVVPPNSMEAACSPTSPRFPTIPVLQITRHEAAGGEECGGSQRVPKADWMLSVMRLPAGKSATIVFHVTEPAEWAGDLYAHLGISYTTADRATPAELKRTEQIGLGMMIVGLEPGGRVVAPGEGGPAIKRAVELFDRRDVADPVLID